MRVDWAIPYFHFRYDTDILPSVDKFDIRTLWLSCITYFLCEVLEKLNQDKIKDER